MRNGCNPHRLFGLASLVLFWVLVIFCRLVHLQLFQHDVLLQKARQQQQGFIEIAPRRGDILDRNLEELAVSVAMDSLYCRPKELEDVRLTAQQLASILGLKEGNLCEKLTSGAPFVYIKRKITPREAEQVRALDAHGIYFQKESKRFYPMQELGSHVIGFVGMDNMGLAGIEYLLDKEIRGDARKVPVTKDARRQILFGAPDENSHAGSIVVLNLDKNIQYIVEQQLSAAVEKFHAAGGASVVINTHTGEVLAMAACPTFNPNQFGSVAPEIRRNRAILDTYEPGSTFKLVTASAALEERVVYPEERINCAVGTVSLGGKIFREAHNSYGILTFNEIITKSSNVGSIKLGLRLGEERFYQYIRKFHFGQTTGIELPGEQSGLLRPPEDWSKLSIGAISIGQEIGVTPLQVACAFATVANGGEWIQPRIINRILSPEGKVIQVQEPRRYRVISADTAAKIRAALGLVVEEGTGKLAKPDGYSAAGKTGTAQKYIDGAYSRTRYIASFVGFAPVEDPALVALVMIDEPKGAIYGGSVAAPVFKEIVERSLVQLRVPQKREGLRFAKSLHGKDLPAGSGNEDLSADENEAIDVQRVVETALREEPSLQDGGQKGTLVVPLLEDSQRLPDFKGKSVREVARICSRLGLKLKVTGAGRAVAQRPSAGSIIYGDTVCEVFFNFQPIAVRTSLEFEGIAQRN
ncbi:MAG TPA: penicillin-binding protein [Acidobacteriota bacterium]|jgi:cell division protein FtsI (penicillin-binding protein 3)|nr:penicillin-binding protein [Acidobacteriota bacterium]